MFILLTEVDFYENYNIDHIVIPVNAERLEQVLKEVGYDKNKTEYVVKGFKTGFNLKYKGYANVRMMAPNLKLRVGSKFDVWSKIMKEVKAGRYAGPYLKIPFDNFIQSPIGLVPKNKNKTRLILYLSYPKDKGTSVNAGIPKDECTMKYPDFAEAIKMCLDEENLFKKGHIFVSKSDMSMAFRHVPMKIKDFRYIILKAEHPLTGVTYFFINKCLPFGSSISCKLFQEVSNCIAYIVSYHTQRQTLNYLDDHYFVAIFKA